MIDVSQSLKNTCNNDKLKYREYIVVDGITVDIKGQLSATAYKDTTFFGTFNMKMLNFETENNIDYKKKEFVYYKEINGTPIKIGTFITTEVKDSDTFESVKVTAYDYALKFAVPYQTSLDYASGEVTMFDVTTEMCSNVGVELENTSLPNGSFIVDSNQFVNDEQYGDVACLIARDNGTFATINNNDKLEFVFRNETDEIIEDYEEFDDKRDTHPFTCVLVATSEDLATAGAVRKDEELIAQYGENWLKIYDYAFAYSSDKCDELVDAIFNQVKGFGYSSFTTKYSFKPYMTLGDTLRLKNKDGELINSILLRYNTNYDDITLEAPSIISASVDYELPETPENIARKTMIKVDNQNEIIESNVQSINRLNDKTDETDKQIESLETKMTQTNNSFNASITEIVKNLESGVENVKNELVTIDINGISVSTNLSAISTIMTNDTFAIKSGDTFLAFFGYDSETQRTKAEMDNLTVTNYFVTGYHRFEKFEPDGEQRTGIFFIGDDA